MYIETTNSDPHISMYIETTNSDTHISMYIETTNSDVVYIYIDIWVSEFVVSNSAGTIQ
jgi:hypothetical protein